MIKPFLAVPPQAQNDFIFWASRPMSVSLVSMPSTMVTARPNFLVSRRTLMRCCSLLISPQTQMSLGSPHVGQISGIVLCCLGNNVVVFKNWVRFRQFASFFLFPVVFRCFFLFCVVLGSCVLLGVLWFLSCVWHD